MYNCNIDEIMDMLDWNNSIEIQEKGIELGRNVKCYNVFLQPGHGRYKKNVWDNCAKILAEKTDDELYPYGSELLNWLQDANWPGFFVIYERLKKMVPSRIISMCYTSAIEIAQKTGEENWLNYLAGLIENEKLFNELPEEYQKLMKEHYKNFWGYEE